MAKEGSEIFERLGEVVEKAWALARLGWVLYYDDQLASVKGAVSHAIDLLSVRDEQFCLCECHHLLGNIYRSEDDAVKAFEHFEVALGIASCFNWLSFLFGVHFDLARLFLDQPRFDDAYAHIQHAKSLAVSNHASYVLARTMLLLAQFLHRQKRFEEAKMDALRAVELFETLGAISDAEDVRCLLRQVDHKT